MSPDWDLLSFIDRKKAEKSALFPNWLYFPMVNCQYSILFGPQMNVCVVQPYTKQYEILGSHSSGRGRGSGGLGGESVERAESGKAAFTQERELLGCAGSLLSNYAI